MIAHEAEGVDTMPEPLRSFLEQEVEASPVPVIEKDGLPCVAAKDDMIECPWEVDSWFTGHGFMLSNKLKLCKPDPNCVPHTRPPVIRNFVDPSATKC